MITLVRPCAKRQRLYKLGDSENSPLARGNLGQATARTLTRTTAVRSWVVSSHSKNLHKSLLHSKMLPRTCLHLPRGLVVALEPTAGASP